MREDNFDTPDGAFEAAFQQWIKNPAYCKAYQPEEKVAKWVFYCMYRTVLKATAPNVHDAARKTFFAVTRNMSYHQLLVWWTIKRDCSPVGMFKMCQNRLLPPADYGQDVVRHIVSVWNNDPRRYEKVWRFKYPTIDLFYWTTIHAPPNSRKTEMLAYLTLQSAIDTPNILDALPSVLRNDNYLPTRNEGGDS